MEHIPRNGYWGVLRIARAVIVTACSIAQLAYANPVGPTVVNGSASFSTQGNLLSVTNSPGAILNWRSFSIGQSEITKFVQQSSASAVLNRVTGLDPSSILGTLQSNGRVFLINPNGITFGQGAQINVAGLVASTLNLSNADFLAGRLNFTETPGAKGITNQGNITTPAGGQVYLVAPDINNSGVITSPRGEIILAAGNSVQLVDPGTPELRVEITAPDNQALNLGQIMADSGRVGIYAGLIRNSGTISANTAVIGENGIIVLKAIKDVTLDAGSLILGDGAQGGAVTIQAGGNAFISGTIEANGSEANGGTINITANALLHTGEIHADGVSGGSVLLQANSILQSGAITADGNTGQGGSVSLAATGGLIQTSAALISASSINGDGGKVLVQGGDSDRLFTSATMDTTGQHGGEIDILGSDLVLAGASLDASGKLGGGTILVGGDYQGTNPDIKNAVSTFVNYSTAIKADAGSQGNGGKVILWADNNTQFYGSISARGGSKSGDGGFIEVSGKENLTFGGIADAGAAQGKLGTLLLDPKNITIAAPSSGVSAFQLLNPHPAANDFFAQSIVALPNNNVVATDPNNSFVANNAGAVYLFNGKSGALISALTGSSPFDGVGNGGVTALTNGNYVVRSSSWNNGTAAFAGAVTFGSGTTGVSGTVSAANSLVGSTMFDSVGEFGVTALTNGNYVVSSASWTNGGVMNAGAVTFGNGKTGISGTVSAANSLVGTTTNDEVGISGVTALTNGNYLVKSPNWNNGGATSAGAVTFGNGKTGVSGTVSAANSLVGTTAGDSVGNNGVTVLTNGNYLVLSPFWNNGAATNAAGAVTFGSGTTGVSGAVSAANSLVGTSTFDTVGISGVTALTNGNYVVSSANWSNGAANDAGAVTFGNGKTGVSGTVSAANSLVGTTMFDFVGGFGVTALTNGNYVVQSPAWNNGVGAATFGNGKKGIAGPVSAANSLMGTTPGDQVGLAVTALANGNYVVGSRAWNNGVGAATFGNGKKGITGPVSAANSLVGSTANDQVGIAVTALPNGNYLVRSITWSDGAVLDVGAVTFGDGKTGVSGPVSASNSLVGTTMFDFVGGNGITVLSNGNYVVSTFTWNNGGAMNAGAVTFGNGKTGVIGSVSAANSLVGTAANDLVGVGGVTALTNGNYVVRSPFWSNGGAMNAGAVTFGNGKTGVIGPVSAANSLVGITSNDFVGISGVTALTNGNYVVLSPEWNNGTATNAGAVTFGNGKTGVSGVVSAANSLVGTTMFDFVGISGVTALTNGNYVALSPNWNNGAVTNAGAVTFANGKTGISGAVSASNSLVGTTMFDSLGNGGVTPLANGNVVVNSPTVNNGGLPNSGAIYVLKLDDED